MKHTITEIVKGNTANFSYYRAGVMYYSILVEDLTYTFPVYLDDIGDATLNNQEKAIMLMRYVRRAISDETIVCS